MRMHLRKEFFLKREAQASYPNCIYSAGLRGTAQTVSKKLMGHAPGPIAKRFCMARGRYLFSALTQMQAQQLR